jgi:hypothetical protein
VGVEDLARADPLPVVLAWLDGHPALVEALGGTGRVGPVNEPPYPRLRVTDPPGGDDRDLRWLISTEVLLEAYGDLDGSPGKAALRRILYLAVGVLAELPGQPYQPGQPVITDVRSSRAGGWVPEPTGQPRYLGSVRVFSHP